jgi:twitching motility protein PilT
VSAAETGHLVFGTLHTTTAISTIDRVVDQFSADRPEPIRTMLAESLKGVVAQTLLKKVGGGRIAAQEILMVNSAVSAMIREGKVHMIPTHMQSQKADGNILLNEALMNLINKKLVAPKDAWIKAVDKGNLIERMKQAGVDLTWYQTIAAA